MIDYLQLIQPEEEGEEKIVKILKDHKTKQTTVDLSKKETKITTIEFLQQLIDGPDYLISVQTKNAAREQLAALQVAETVTESKCEDIYVRNVDTPALHRQKLMLVQLLIAIGIKEDTNHELWGLVNLIDIIEDDLENLHADTEP